ncbi:hypothetical protein HPB50_015152 [Hyalomma asiaticum]|uniref:Uncharacterized protein n=1 Tax=Hyalomma asiaticum TaxID=266040 RepID=A0ACB7T4R3_HYAAI|nr:hypothetical protein HPB50_015152 [Hyalomma asiaticum]
MLATMASAGRAVLAIAVALAVAGPDAVVSAGDVHPRHPNLIERIMGPVVREMELTQLRIEPIIEPFVVEGFGLPSVFVKGDGNNVNVNAVDIGSDNAKGHKSVVVSSSSGLAEPPSPLSRFGGGRRNVNLMQYFWNNFMAAPPMMSPAVMQVPRKPAFGKNVNHISRTVFQKRGGGNGTGGKPEEGIVSVDFEVIVVPNSAADANGNASEAGKNGLMSRMFPGVRSFQELPRNRSAYSVVEAFPAQYVAVDRAAVPTSAPALDDDASSDAYATAAYAKVTLLMMLMAVACCISCILGGTLPAVLKDNRGRTTRAPSVWVTKTGQLLRLNGASGGASPVAARYPHPWWRVACLEDSLETGKRLLLQGCTHWFPE